MFQYCGGRAGEVRAQKVSRKKCLVSLEYTSDPAFQKLFMCMYASRLCDFHFFFLCAYILLVVMLPCKY